jgi:hypothetical protein
MGVFHENSEKEPQTNTILLLIKKNLRVLSDFPVRLTTKPFPSTCGSYEKGCLFGYWYYNDSARYHCW